ncbi:hypothetical protein [Candidatus Phytoplasma ziziphi]|uniref:hypothetical protein n=1 Tax=Ziziphus jujuba witches'-broom phytoplasma TaxID=135727 RepID=UPI00137505DB|nr:hypothetical protein [Candidatus Phytoplasma ziziphi]
MYEGMLSGTIKLRDSIQCDYDETSTNRLFGSPPFRTSKTLRNHPIRGIKN